MAHNTYKNKNGIIIPSVTTIINQNLGWSKEALIAWANKIGLDGKKVSDIRKEACDTGTLAHSFIEAYIRTYEKIDIVATRKLTELKNKATLEQIVIAERALEQYKIWEKEKNIIHVACEHEFVNEEYQFGGCCDLICDMPERTLIDFKTSKYITSDQLIQISAYYKSLENVFNLKNAILIHIRKDFSTIDSEKNKPIITAIIINREYIEGGWEAFKLLREIHKQKDKLKSFEKEQKNDPVSSECNQSN